MSGANIATSAIAVTMNNPSKLIGWFANRW
jgi:hypothetical protein